MHKENCNLHTFTVPINKMSTIKIYVSFHEVPVVLFNQLNYELTQGSQNKALICINGWQNNFLTSFGVF